MGYRLDLFHGEIYHAVHHNVSPERRSLDIDKLHLALVYDSPKKDMLRLQVVGEIGGFCLDVEYTGRAFTIEEGREEFRKLTDRVYEGKYSLEPGEDSPVLKLSE